MRLLRKDLHMPRSHEMEVPRGQEVLLQLEMHPGIQEEEEMTITQCDRCGKQIQGVMLVRLHAGYGEPLKGIRMDLCDDCAKDLRRWANEQAGTKDQKKS